MSDWMIRSAAVVFMMGAAGCAHTQPKVASDSAAYVAPTLIACGGYTPPTFHWTESNRVSIRMKVQRDGSVAPSSLHHEPSRYDRGGRSAVERAKSFAAACAFEPAYEAEEPVEAWTSVRFAFR